MRKKIGAVLTAVILGGTGAAAAAVPSFASDKAVETVYLGDSKYVYWESDTVGRWSSVSKAHEYQVKLYIGDDIDLDDEEDASNRKGLTNSQLNQIVDEGECVVMKRTTQTSFDFSLYMNDLHTYFFVVRAVPKTSEQAYVEAGNWTASPTVDFKASSVMGATGGRWRNYLEGSRYQDADGNYLGAGWNLIQGSWYRMDENGYRLTGWQTVDGDTYYLNEEDGRMATGWFVWNNSWYYADKNGKRQNGWIMDTPGNYYYLYEDGTMAHDTQIDGFWLDSSGRRIG